MVSVDSSFREFLEGLQKVIAQLDLFSGWRPRKLGTVCGVDVSYEGRKAAAAAVLWSILEKKVLEVSQYRGEAQFPYIPSYLFLREAPLMIAASSRLRRKPELVLVDGHGLAHPRGAGLAVFVGLLLRRPTLGVAKSLLVGTIGRSKNSIAPINLEGKTVGFQMSPPVGKKYYVSPGYQVNVSDIPRIGRMLGLAYPEALREAHKISKMAIKIR